MTKKSSGLVLAAAVASLFLAGQSLAEEGKSEPKEAKVKCSGINACGGKGACGSAEHSCAGKNSCQGKGWVKASEKECQEKGGKVLAEEKKS